MSHGIPGSFSLRATNGSARRASFTLAHGIVETPAFMPVGTAATVKGLTPSDLRAFGAQIILANTYHLWLRPGRDVIVDAGGLHAFMAWDRPILTDSGGFQVFSLESRRVLTDAGVRFRSHIDGSEHEFTPENVVGFQEALGVDVAMALDVCVKLPASQEEIDEAVRRTSLWAARSAAARTRAQTLLFGIVQGGLDLSARARSAEDLLTLDLPGYAIGGLSVGETR
ncbi:MAG TPA: tRNA guanosine(34) transglycosylase Tgt, partial [Candidatus Baltobacteraceae bacterium]